MTKDKLCEYFAAKIFGENYKENMNFLQDANIKDLVDKLFDLNSKTIPLLDARTTYILRRKYGILDCKKGLSFRNIGDEFNITRQAIEQIMKNAEICLINYVKFYRKFKAQKPSSLVLSKRYLELKDQNLSEINLSRRLLIVYFQLGITTTKELLSYTKYDLKKMEISAQRISETENKLKNLGLKFIDDLTLEEKLLLISLSKDKNNLSAGFLSSNSLLNKFRDLYKYPIKLDTLGEVYNLAKNKNVVMPQEVLEDLEDLGYFVPASKKIESLLASEETQEKKINKVIELNLPYEVLITLSLKSFAIEYIFINPNKLRSIVTTIGELLELNRSDLPNIMNLGEKRVSELINLVHSLGLFFKDEIEIINVYCQAVQDELSFSSPYTSLTRIKPL